MVRAAVRQLGYMLDALGSSGKSKVDDPGKTTTQFYSGNSTFIIHPKTRSNAAWLACSGKAAFIARDARAAVIADASNLCRTCVMFQQKRSK
jgi:hypothetical protein